LSDHATDDRPSEEESIEDNAMMRMLKKAKNAEAPKNKTADTASTLHMEEIKRLIARHEQGVEK
jgi:hypothetical protein